MDAPPEPPRASFDSAIFRHRDAPIALLAVPIALIHAAPPSAAFFAAGAAAVLAGLLIRLASVRYIGKRARVHRMRADALSTKGPFHVVRTPIYVGNALMMLGLGLVAGPPLYAAAAFAIALAWYRVVVHVEEGALSAIYGRRYEVYRAATGRFLPRLGALSRRRFLPARARRVAWSEVFGRESGLAIAVPVLVAAAALKARIHVAYHGLLPLGSVVLEDLIAATAGAIVVGVGAFRSARRVARQIERDRIRAESLAARHAES